MILFIAGLIVGVVATLGFEFYLLTKDLNNDQKDVMSADVDQREFIHGGMGTR